MEIINDKIKQIIIQSGYSPSHFADEIGVQRSSISHILANRNKPSFDIIQKIMKRFPHLGFDWLNEEIGNATNTRTTQPMMGSNGIPQAKRGPKPRYVSYSDEYVQQNQLSKTTNMPSQNSYLSSENMSVNHLVEALRENVIPSNETQLSSTPSTNMDVKKVERIIVFYSDNSFKEYLPNQ
jgi:transcriptional regulator with XRE-family HTH domain